MNVTIMGAGSWGCALARILGDNGNDVMMYDTNEETIEQINNTHTSSKLSNGSLPLCVSGTTELNEAIDFSNVIVLCVPTKFMRSALKNIGKNLKGEKLFVNASKGVEPDTFKRVSEIVEEEIPANLLKGYVAIYGPTHAEEVIEQKLTLASAVSENENYAKLVQQLFNNTDYFGVETGDDVIGAELCGALKNIYALAGGMLEGLGYGDNAKAGLITRALREIKQIVTAQGGKASTVVGLTGVGDLIATATSHHSRNFQAGLQLVSGKSADEIMSSMTMVVEGVRAVQAIYPLCKQLGLNCPIIEAIYDVVYNKKNAYLAIKDVMLNPTQTTKGAVKKV